MGLSPAELALLAELQAKAAEPDPSEVVAEEIAAEVAAEVAEEVAAEVAISEIADREVAEVIGELNDGEAERVAAETEHDVAVIEAEAEAVVAVIEAQTEHDVAVLEAAAEVIEEEVSDDAPVSSEGGGEAVEPGSADRPPHRARGFAGWYTGPAPWKRKKD